jgi:transposase
MKSFKRTKIINGIEYVYEITPYYDPSTKKVKQKSRYIGKDKDGTITKVREKKMSQVLSYGEFLPLMKIIKQYSIDQFLTKELNKIQAEQILAITTGKVLRGLSLNNISDWYENTWMYFHTRDIPLSSSSISRLLNKIGESRLQDKLSAHLIRQLKSKRTILYDITSVSSYSELIRLLEWGYNRDGYDLPQINLSVILDKQEGIPLGYEIYPGSITDVVTLQNTIKRIGVYGIKDFTLVLDRGFFSYSNVELLLKRFADFIMAVPERYQSAEKLLSSLVNEIERPKYLKKFNDEIIFVKDVEIDLKGCNLKAYCYFNPARAQQEKDSFYKRLFSIREQIERLKVNQSWHAHATEIMGNLNSYFEIKVIDEKVVAQIKEKAVSRRLNKKGLFLIAYNGQYTWDSCLTVYKERELIERSFDILKNDLEFTTPGVHKDATLKGLMFINMIALILRMKIMNILKQNNLIKTYSFEKMILQLEKMKAVVLDNGQVIYSEITKKQREILEPFDAVPKL